MIESTVDTERRAAVVRSDGEYRLVTNQAVPAGTLLFILEGELTATPTRYTVQFDENRHVDMPAGCPLEEVLDRYYWRFMNHACEPAAVIRDRSVLSLRPIPAWSEITFHYATTEYTVPGMKKEAYLSESGVRRMAELSRAPEAKRFLKWFDDEVVKALEKSRRRLKNTATDAPGTDGGAPPPGKT